MLPRLELQYQVDTFRLQTHLEETATAITSGEPVIIVVTALILQYVTSRRRITAKGEKSHMSLQFVFVNLKSLSAFVQEIFITPCCPAVFGS